MKIKFLSVVGCGLLLLLAACGAKPQTTDAGNTATNSHEEVSKEKEELTVTVVDEVFAAWKRTESVHVSYSAELKNENSVPVSIERMHVEFLDENDEVLDGVFLDPIPAVIMPNETAYVVESTGIRADDFTDPAKVKGITVEMEVVETDKELLKLETDDVQFELLFKDASLPYKVTGTITNPHAPKIDHAKVTVGLYNDKDELVAVLIKMVETNLGENDSVEFETSHPPLSNDLYGKATKVKAIAYEDPQNY